MTSKKLHWSTYEKIRIALQRLKDHPRVAEIYRQNNQVPKTTYNWKE